MLPNKDGWLGLGETQMGRPGLIWNIDPVYRNGVGMGI